MPQPVDLGYATTLEPSLAVDYFRAKGYEITWNWQEANAATHAKAFTVAKAARLDILETIYVETERAKSQGITEREFKQTLTPRLQEQRWWGKQVIVDSGVVASIRAKGHFVASRSITCSKQKLSLKALMKSLLKLSKTKQKKAIF